jgi:hypothetical protein
MSQDRPARELTPMQMFWKSEPSAKDFTVNVMPSDADEKVEAEEVEEAITPAPKASTAPESVISAESQPPSAPAKSETLATHVAVDPTAFLVAVSESGKVNVASEDEPETEKETKPVPDSSSQSSSTETSPGSSTPPASVSPPPVASPPVAPTIPTP